MYDSRTGRTNRVWYWALCGLSGCLGLVQVEAATIYFVAAGGATNSVWIGPPASTCVLGYQGWTHGLSLPVTLSFDYMDRGNCNYSSLCSTQVNVTTDPFTVYFCGAGAPATNTWVSLLSLTNNTGLMQSYTIGRSTNGLAVPMAEEVLTNDMWLLPGAIWTMGPITNNLPWRYSWLGSDETGGLFLPPTGYEGTGTTNQGPTVVQHRDPAQVLYPSVVSPQLANSNAIVAQREGVVAQMNQQAEIQKATAGALSNLTYAVNVLRSPTANLATNRPDGAGFPTNIATETTLRGVTNMLGGISNVLGSMQAGAIWAVSNALSGTNVMPSVAWSNYVGPIVGVVSTMQAYAAGDVAGMKSILEESTPPAEFGVLQIRSDIRSPGTVTKTVDSKLVFGLGKLEQKLTGLKMWIQVFILWAALGAFIWWLMEELRRAVWQALSPSPTPTPTWPLVVGTLGGPEGTVAGAILVGWWKFVMSTLVVTILLALPAVTYVGLQTVLTLLGGGPDLFGSLITTVKSGPPSIMGQTVSVLSGWIPVLGLAVIGLNAALTNFAMDGAVTIVTVLMKIASP